MFKGTKLLQAFFIACAMMFTSVSHAVLPDNGWYWNPNEGGRGFNIEIQNNLLFMSAFIYDAQGKPIWLVSGGAMTSDHAYSGQLYQTSGGQCMGCAYKPAAETLYGTATINFTGATTATISINGIAVQAQRQAFGIDFSNVATPLLGEWAFVEGSAAGGFYMGDRIMLTKTMLLSGQLGAVGSRTGSPSKIAAGFWQPSDGWGILVDYSATYYDLFVFTFAAFDRIEGYEYFYLKTGSPGNGVPFVAQRIKSAAAAAGQIAPGTGKALASTIDSEAKANKLADDKSLQIASMGSGITASMAVPAMASKLEAMIREVAQ